MEFVINAKRRETKGSGASRRLRRAGALPGIVYGGKNKPQSVELDQNEMLKHMKNEAFYSSVLELNVEGKKQSCLLRDVQRHPYKTTFLHFDFQRVDAKHEIHQKVPLHFINAEIAPGVKLGGGMVQHILTELDIRCLPADLPTHIEVDCKDLNAGESIHVSQLTLPKGVESNIHREDDPVIVSVVVRGGGKSFDVEEPTSTEGEETAGEG